MNTNEDDNDTYEPDSVSSPVELTVTVNVDVEDSTNGDENGEFGSTDADFGIGAMPQKSPVSARLLQHTHSLYHAAKELEESKGRVRHEDDIWWDQRGTKPYQQQYRGNFNKSLAHVTSKLHVPTAATIFWQREKANLEKVRPKPLPRLENPDAINPYVNVKPKVTHKTAAAQRQEWSAWKEKLKEDEEKLAAEIAAKNASKPKVRSTSDRLLSMPDNRKAAKVHKEVDKREANWKRVAPHEPAWKETSPLPKSTGNGYNISDTASEVSGNGGSPGSKSGLGSGQKTLTRSRSVERLYRVDLPDYKQYVPPARPKSPTPCGFGSSTTRATTPTEVRRRSLTPSSSHGAGDGRSTSAGSGSMNRRLSGSSVSSMNSSINGNSPVGTQLQGRSRAAEARQRVQNRDRTSPQTTPFEQVMRAHNIQSNSAAATTPSTTTSITDGVTEFGANVAETIKQLGNNVASAILQEPEMF